MRPDLPSVLMRGIHTCPRPGGAALTHWFGGLSMTSATSAVPSVVTEVTGLGGAIGCDFIGAAQRLVFVEYSGKLSRFDLFPSATVVSSGTTVLHGTYTFDLDTGTEGGIGGAEDIWWEQQTNVARQMVP